MDDIGTDSDYSESSGSVSSTSGSSSNESAYDDDTTELTRITKQTVRLPKGLCENSAIFREFFSIGTWKSLPSNFQAYLKNKFLPNFPDNNDIEQEKSIEMLFNNQISRFNRSPMIDLQKNLEDGSYRPDVLKLRQSISRSRRRENRFQECERVSQLAKTLMISRERLLRTAYDAPPGTILKIDRIINSAPQMNNTAAALRARKRFFEEISVISKQVGLNDLSDDEKSLSIDRENDMKKDPSAQISPNNETKIIGTMCRKNRTTSYSLSFNEVVLNENNFKQVLIAHKKRKLEEPDRPEFDTNDIRLRDVHARAQILGGYRKSLGGGRLSGKKSKLKQNSSENQSSLSQTDSTKNNFVSNQQQQQQQQQVPPSRPKHNKSQTIRHESAQQSPNNENSNTDSEDDVNVDSITPPSYTQQTSIDDNLKRRSIPQQQPILSGKGTKKMLLNVNGTTVSDSISSNLTKIVDMSTEQPSPNTNSMQLPQYHGKIKAATLSDLEGIDMMHLPIDLDESGHMDILNDIKPEPSETSGGGGGPELMQETHACFLSLIRDIFCSTPNHRMRLDELKTKIYTWLANPITALNDWYCQADNWLALITSAIHFLAGEFIDQPEDFVPYIEFKIQMNIYQWIGAGRDSDQHLIQLCNYWLMRRNEMGNKPLQKFELNNRKSTEFEESLMNERPISPPPPRCPTSWIVQPATPDEVTDFRLQERQRFDNPHRAFTYRMHGYESVVGPVKGIYTQILALTKARGHNMLTADRPNFVTILTLVRDATARLPNGEGTRADICELLKSSQYINPQAQDSILQTIVSGALDRMHTEHDPCVRYDPKRKIWIYLHRNRSIEEFERLHQQFQGIGKHKKPSNRKVKQKPTKIIHQNSLPMENNNNNTASVATVMVVPSTSNITAIPKSLPALSTIQVNAPATIQNSNLTNSTNPPPLKISPQKTLVKPELVPIKSTTTPTNERLEAIDIEATLDAQSAPVILHKPLLHQQQQNLQGLPTLVVEKQIQKGTTIKKPMLTATSTIPSTQIKVATPTGIQTVHVSSASVPVSAITPDGKHHQQQQLTSILATSPLGQSILLNQTNSQNQQQIVLGNKKLTKPILINQNQTSSLLSQVGPSGQGYIIPININNPEQLKGIPAMSSALLATSNLSPKLIKSNQPPALTSTIGAAKQSTLIHQSGKNFVRVATTTAQAGKSLISPHVAATNITLQQQQKLLGNVAATNISLQQKITTVPGQTITGIRPQLQQKNTGISIINNTATIKAHPSLTPVQQKQILQNIISQQQQQQQQKQRSNSGNLTQNTVVIPHQGQQTIQTKPVVIAQGNVQQQLQKLINVSSTPGGLTSVSVGGNIYTTNTSNMVTSPGANLISPQIIQIHQTGQTSGGGTKVQTLNTSNLTPQQQQNLLQSIKQQQIKLQQQQQQQHSQNQNQHQSLIIKQQPVFHQIQKSQNPSTSNTISVSVGTGTSKTVTSLIGTNVSNLISSNQTSLLGGTNVLHQSQNIVKHQTLVQQQQQQQQQNVGKQINIGGTQQTQQTITRVIKSGASIIHPQVQVSTVSGVRTQSGNPVMAKVLTNTSGQIISLESLLQKQGMAPGTTLRVAGAKPTQTSLIQLAGAPGSQITQYAVVSQGRNLISVGAPQRMITTQASNSNTVVTSLGNVIGKITDHKNSSTTTLNSGQLQQHQQLQNQPKIITANQLTAQQLVNAKVLGKSGASGIRMVNASNLNIAHLRGKPVIIASKPANVGGQQTGQNIILQGPANSTNLVIGGQTLKVQGNVMSSANVQVLNQPSSSSQSQTVVLSNQILKVQQPPPLKSPITTNIINNNNSNNNNIGVGSGHLTTLANISSGTTVVNSNTNYNAPKTVVLGSTGQTIRVQSPAQVQLQSGGNSTQGHPMLLGTTVKGTQIKNPNAGQQRVVLAVQGGGQILLPPGFQGGAINLKTLQGLKVVSIAQQQNKGQSDERPMFAQIVAAPQAPRPPPNPGGE